MAGKYMRPPPEASLTDRGRAKGRKAAKRAGTGAASLQGFRKFSTPSGLQVRYPSCMTPCTAHLSDAVSDAVCPACGAVHLFRCQALLVADYSRSLLIILQAALRSFWNTCS